MTYYVGLDKTGVHSKIHLLLSWRFFIASKNFWARRFQARFLQFLLDVIEQRNRTDVEKKE